MPVSLKASTAAATVAAAASIKQQQVGAAAVPYSNQCGKQGPRTLTAVKHWSQAAACTGGRCTSLAVDRPLYSTTGHQEGRAKHISKEYAGLASRLFAGAAPTCRPGSPQLRPRPSACARLPGSPRVYACSQAPHQNSHTKPPRLHFPATSCRTAVFKSGLQHVPASRCSSQEWSVAGAFCACASVSRPCPPPLHSCRPSCPAASSVSSLRTGGRSMRPLLHAVCWPLP